MTKKKSTGMVSLKEAYEKAMNQKKHNNESNKKHNNEITKESNKTNLSSNISGVKIDSSFELDSLIKTDIPMDCPNEKQKKYTDNELDFNFKGLNIQVARRF